MEHQHSLATQQKNNTHGSSYAQTGCGVVRDLVDLLAPHETRPPLEWFSSIAKALLQDWRLEAGDKVFVLRELEFYLHRPGHEDPFVHQNEAQLLYVGSWYFHRAQSATKRFTLKGLDLTFGEPGTEYGGVLIRAMQEIGQHGGKYIEGPSKVVNSILDAHGMESVSELQSDAWYTRDAFECPLLRLIPGVRLAIRIVTMSRHGLSPKNNKPYADVYRSALYRYKAEPDETSTT